MQLTDPIELGAEAQLPKLLVGSSTLPGGLRHPIHLTLSTLPQGAGSFFESGRIAAMRLLCQATSLAFCRGRESPGRQTLRCRLLERSLAEGRATSTVLSPSRGIREASGYTPFGSKGGINTPVRIEEDHSEARGVALTES